MLWTRQTMPRAKGIRAKVVSGSVVAMVAFAVAVMAGVILILNQSIQRSAALDALETNRAYCESAINDFSNASDYLTNEVWQYARTGDITYMQNYWTEADVTRTRDQAIQKLLHSDLSNQETTHVMRAKASSDSLMVDETRAMRLIADGQGVPLESMPREVRDYELTADEQALSSDEKLDAARDYLYGASYEQTKQNIRSTIQSFHSDLTSRMEANTAESLETGRKMGIMATAGVVVLMGMLIAAVVANSRTMGKKNAQLLDALGKAQAASDAKSYFTSRMSHEIRTPLNAVMGYLTLAENEDDAVKKEAQLEKSHIAAQNLLGIVNDVLDLSAVENNRMKLAHDPFSLGGLLADLKVVYSSQASSKGIAFKIEEVDVSVDVLLGDRMRLNQILTNLLSNAIKFTPRDGTVRLEAAQRQIDGQGVAEKVMMTFSVIDNGIGMSSDFLPRVFDPYEQADAGISQKYGGTGLGLSIVKSMVEMMGGSVGVESVEGKGSTFTVHLPYAVATREEASALAAEQATSQDVDEELSKPQPLTGMAFLLAEDNVMNSEIAQSILRRNGACVDVVDNGQEAVDAFCASDVGCYDAILMDIQMPKLNGYEATAAIRASSHPEAKSIPIVAMTANAFQEDVKKASESGMNAHIAKPLDIPSMLRVLGNLRRTDS